MALVNPLISYSPISSRSYRKKYTVTPQDMINLGAFTTGDITLDTLPAGTILTGARIKHTAAVSIATSLSARLFFVTDVAAAQDVFAAANDTLNSGEKTSVTAVQGLINATNPLLMKFTNGGANMNTIVAATSGSVEAWIEYYILY